MLRRGLPFPSSRGRPGTVQLAQGHPGWLFWHARWGIELQTILNSLSYSWFGVLAAEPEVGSLIPPRPP